MAEGATSVQRRQGQRAVQRSGQGIGGQQLGHDRIDPVETVPVEVKDGNLRKVVERIQCGLTRHPGRQFLQDLPQDVPINTACPDLGCQIQFRIAKAQVQAIRDSDLAGHLGHAGQIGDGLGVFLQAVEPVGLQQAGAGAEGGMRRAVDPDRIGQQK